MVDLKNTIKKIKENISNSDQKPDNEQGESPEAVASGVAPDEEQQTAVSPVEQLKIQLGQIEDVIRRLKADIGSIQKKMDIYQVFGVVAVAFFSLRTSSMRLSPHPVKKLDRKGKMQQIYTESGPGMY